MIKSQSHIDKELLLSAIALAEKGQFTCQPNPRVGCILTQDNDVIGKGWHHKSGEGHAEVNAIADAINNQQVIQGATAYVSLEPCSFTGKTPPCVDALFDAGVSRVVCAGLDPNPRVSGKGLKILNDRGIIAEVSTDSDVLERAEWLNRGFFKRMRHGLPWVMLKTASSIDGRTADYQGKSQWITSSSSREDVHALRAQSCAIITGSGTQQADNPTLNARLDSDIEVKQPLRVLLDSQCVVTANANIIGKDNNVLIFTINNDPKVLGKLEKNTSIQLVNSINLDSVLTYLAGKEINFVMIEAGARLSGAFIEAGLVDEIVHYIAPSIIGSQGRGMFDFSNSLSLDDKKTFMTRSVETLDEDIKITFKRRTSNTSDTN